MSYLYDKNDGKIHTRYTELKSCTTTSVWRVLRNRELGSPLHTVGLNFGHIRHQLWDEEIQRTGKLPECFERDDAVDFNEHEIVAELLPGVIVHGRLDAITHGSTRVVDFKTMAAHDLKSGVKHANDMYRNAKQLKVYAYILGLNGFRIIEAEYLIEIWDRDYKKILGYTSVIQPINMTVIMPIVSWIEDRIAILVAAYDEYHMEKSH